MEFEFREQHQGRAPRWLTNSSTVGASFFTEDLNGRPVLVRFIISEIKANPASFEQSFSTDGGKTWEANWIAIDTRVKE